MKYLTLATTAVCLLQLSACMADSTTDGSSCTDGCTTDSDSPTLSDDFATDSGNWYSRQQDDASITFASADAAASDGVVLSLLFPGNDTLTSSDRTTPEYATEVWTRETLHYGRYEVNVQFADCADDEEVVSGIFTYYNDGSDNNDNGLADNSEIDIEYLCGEPQLLWLTVWTDADDSGFRKKTRSINMATGEMYQTPDGGEDQYDSEYAGNLAAIRLNDFPADNSYYTLGFDWNDSYVRWFINVDGEEITLWNMTDKTAIPQHEANFMLNVWHAETHWSSGISADYPANDSTLKVDWFSYQTDE